MSLLRSQDHPVPLVANAKLAARLSHRELEIDFDQTTGGLRQGGKVDNVV